MQNYYQPLHHFLVGDSHKVMIHAVAVQIALPGRNKTAVGM
jgi:hypothetical protein